MIESTTVSGATSDRVEPAGERKKKALAGAAVLSTWSKRAEAIWVTDAHD